MRKLCLLFCVVFVAFGFAQKQGVVTYRLKVLENPHLDDDLESELPELYHSWVKADSIANSIFKFDLKFNDGLSSFTSTALFSANYQGSLRDGVEAVEESSKADQIFYIDRKNNLFVHQLNYWLTDVLIEDAILKNNWVLKNETKVIGGYTCYKAVETKAVSYSNTPIETVAWYTLDINIPIGPLNYGGLPGLILRLDTPTYSYYATNIDLKKSDLKILKPTFGKKMTRNEFDNIKDKLVAKGKKLVREGQY